LRHTRRRRNRTPLKEIGDGLCLYFLGLSYRKAAKALPRFFKKRSHVSIWKWIQKYRPEKNILYKRRTRISEFIVDE
jgi:hypothetical protein